MTRPHAARRLGCRQRQRRRSSTVAACGRSVAAPAARYLTREQFRAITAVMRLFVEDDLARGVSARIRLRCDACRHARPAPGFIRYDGYRLCNLCATDYEVARAHGHAPTMEVYLSNLFGGPGDGRPAS